MLEIACCAQLGARNGGGAKEDAQAERLAARYPDMSIRVVRLGSPRAKSEGLRIGTVRLRGTADTAAIDVEYVEAFEASTSR